MVNQDVFHIRLNNIAIQAEQIMDPSLKTCSVAIISSEDSNGSIIALSPEAAEEGLFCGMKVSLVRKIAHSTILLPYNKTLYNRIDNHIYTTLCRYTPTVEPNGIGNYFLDMRGMSALRGDMKNTGLSILQHIQNETNLLGIVGISINKLVSKVITTVMPEMIHKVDNGDEKKFLSPLKPQVLPVVNNKIVKRILKFLFIQHIKSIQDISKQAEEFKILFGSYADSLAKQSNGFDQSPVMPPYHLDHIVEQTILPKDTNNETILLAIVKDLAEQIAFRLRKRKQISDRVQLEIHYSDGYKSCSLGKIDNIDDFSVKIIFKKLFLRANKRRNRVRAILVDLCRLLPYIEQINIFDMNQYRSLDISHSIEKIRLKYGVHSLQTADIFHALGRI